MFLEKEQAKIEEKKRLTLIQWLVAILVLGVIFFTTGWLVWNEKMKARDAVRVSYVKQLQAALEVYFNDFGRYPEGDSQILGSANYNCLGEAGFGVSCAGKIYLNYIPLAPAPADGGCNDELNAFTYYSDGSFYQINFCLGKNFGALSAGPRAATFGEIR